MTDTVEAFDARSGSGDVMSAVDSTGDTERFVVADVTRDDAWLATPTADAVSTVEWR